MRYGNRFSRVAVATGVCASAFFFLVTAASAGEEIADAWKVKGRLIGEPKKDDPAERKKASDVSGIACIPGPGLPQVCLVVDDEVEHAQVLLLEDGRLRAGDCITLSGDCKATRVLEIDAEGVAYAGGAFYVIGSHGRPRNNDGNMSDAAVAERLKAASALYTVRLADGSVDLDDGDLSAPPSVTRSEGLVAAIKGQSDLSSRYNLPIDDGGISVEGIAATDANLIVGFRTPVIDGKTPLLAVSRTALDEGTAPESKLSYLDLGQYSLNEPRGIRDLAVVGNSLMVLAGPSDDPKDFNARAGDYQIYSVDFDQAGLPDPATLHKVRDLPAFGDDRKPESVVYLQSPNSGLRALVLSDGVKEAKPTPVDLSFGG